MFAHANGMSLREHVCICVLHRVVRCTGFEQRSPTHCFYPLPTLFPRSLHGTLSTNERVVCCTASNSVPLTHCSFTSSHVAVFHRGQDGHAEGRRAADLAHDERERRQEQLRRGDHQVRQSQRQTGERGVRTSAAAKVVACGKAGAAGAAAACALSFRTTSASFARKIFLRSLSARVSVIMCVCVCVLCFLRVVCGVVSIYLFLLFLLPISHCL